MAVTETTVDTTGKGPLLKLAPLPVRAQPVSTFSEEQAKFREEESARDAARDKRRAEQRAAAVAKRAADDANGRRLIT